MNMTKKLTALVAVSLLTLNIGCVGPGAGNDNPPPVTIEDAKIVVPTVVGTVVRRVVQKNPESAALFLEIAGVFRSVADTGVFDPLQVEPLLDAALAKFDIDRDVALDAKNGLLLVYSVWYARRGRVIDVSELEYLTALVGIFADGLEKGVREAGLE